MHFGSLRQILLCCQLTSNSMKILWIPNTPASTFQLLVVTDVLNILASNFISLISPSLLFG